MINTYFMNAKYWICSLSIKRSLYSVKDKFIQVFHGAKSKINRMEKGDFLVVYSHKNIKNSDSFLAIGEVTKALVYKTCHNGFHPYRMEIKFFLENPINISNFFGEISCADSEKVWNEKLKEGHFEINAEDFIKIKNKMEKSI